MPTCEEVIKQIDRDLRDRERQNKTLSGQEFEFGVHKALCAKLPYCILPNVVIFRPDQFRVEAEEPGRLAYEIDNVFHYRKEEVDHLIIIETKAQPIGAESGEWTVINKGKTKCVKAQMTSHAEALFRYLRPLGKNIELRVEAIAVSSDRNCKVEYEELHGGRIRLGKLPFTELSKYLATLLVGSNGLRPAVLRVAQSEYLSLLRLGIHVPALGHPELGHAIQYIERCKREIDFELYQSFQPTNRKWAINGTAGMGKSVLLAYATAVFCTDHVLSILDNQISLKDFQDQARARNVAPHVNRSISVMAMKPKQGEVLKDLYHRFMADLNSVSPLRELSTVRPNFQIWSDTQGVPVGCNVLILDEAHDLSSAGQELVRKWHESSDSHYLMLACDRHQKIRLVGANATIIHGLDFRGCSKRLGRNYRNPFPVYASAIALMFRWFAKDGPKVVPTQTEIKDLLGFDLEAVHIPGAGRVLRMKSDVHPANTWSHCVESFRNAAAAYTQLVQHNLQRKDVLWIRFSEEDKDFDYEQLSRFTYHNLATPESADLADKYIKGQEFPVVVLEGFPDVMERLDKAPADGSSLSDGERAMWKFRRELYLCASRATGFLYFICNRPESVEIQRIETELAQLLGQLSTPIDPLTHHACEWRFTVEVPAESLRRTMDVFEEVEPLVKPATRDSEPAPQDAKPVARVISPIVVKDLAAAMGLKPFQIIHELMEMHIFASLNQIIDAETANRVAHKKGFRLEIESKNAP